MQPTKRVTVTGIGMAASVADLLIQRSKWFEMTPLPDDRYEFKVKDESGLPDLRDWDKKATWR